MAELTKEQKKYIDARIKQEGLNEYGDPKNTMYAGGNPLFDMMTGTTKDRYEYILDNHRDWLPQSK
jgi:rhamnogalacturonyl hydrolase YesR